MTELTGRMGTRIKAALSIIHRAGKDVASVERQAQTAIGRGMNPAQAYSRAMQEMFRRAPDLKRTVERVDNLLSNTNDATMQRYEQGVNAYIGSRDETALEALAPMMKADMQALAVRSGEVSVDDAYAGKVDWATLGVPGWAETPQVDASSATETVPAAPDATASAAPVSPFTNQVGVTSSPTGIRMGKAAERWNNAERVSIGDAQPMVRSQSPEQGASI